MSDVAGVHPGRLLLRRRGGFESVMGVYGTLVVREGLSNKRRKEVEGGE